MNRRFMLIALAALCFGLTISVFAQKKARLGKICGDPNLRCRGAQDFQPHELTFEIPRNAIIYESEPFYAIIVKSVKLKSDSECENVFSEEERLDLQAQFPNNKVFALKCSEAGTIYYSNVSPSAYFMAIYAGKTLTEATNFLKTVKAAGKFGKVSLRRMQAGINGT